MKMGTETVERSFPRSITALDGVFDFTNEFALVQSINDKVRYILDLAVEEFFTNMVKYEPEGDHGVSISVEREANRLTVRMVDTGVRPFDVTNAPAADLSASLKERPVGGLGIHISRELLDSVTYEYGEGQSTITFVKTLET